MKENSRTSNSRYRFLMCLKIHMDLTRPMQISTRMTSLSASWQSAKVVRTREKILFFFGVMNVLLSTLLFGLAPQHVVLYIASLDILTEVV